MLIHPTASCCKSQAWVRAGLCINFPNGQLTAEVSDAGSSKGEWKPNNSWLNLHGFSFLALSPWLRCALLCCTGCDAESPGGTEASLCTLRVTCKPGQHRATPQHPRGLRGSTRNKSYKPLTEVNYEILVCLERKSVLFCSRCIHNIRHIFRIKKQPSFRGKLSLLEKVLALFACFTVLILWLYVDYWITWCPYQFIIGMKLSKILLKK